MDNSTLPILLSTDQFSGLSKNLEKEIRQLFVTELSNMPLEVTRIMEKTNWNDLYNYLEKLFESSLYCGTPKLQQELKTTMANLRTNNMLSGKEFAELDLIVNLTLRELSTIQ